MSEPMTAEEIRERYKSETSGEIHFISLAIAINAAIMQMLDWMSAREREAAELAEMRRQIGELGKRLADCEGGQRMIGQIGKRLEDDGR